MRRRDLQDLLLLHTAADDRMRASLAALPVPECEGRIEVLGPDPYRVLMIGAGLAIGYGVRDPQQTLGGRLARVLAERTRRGVILEHRLEPEGRLRDIPALVGARGALTYDLAVICPGFAELTRTWRTARWSTDMRSVLQHLVDAGDQRTRYLLLGFAPVESREPVGRIVAGFVRRVNTRIEQVAPQFPRTAFAVPPAAIDLTAMLTSEYYAASAEGIAPAVLGLLGARVRQS